MEYHRVANIFPLMHGEEYRQLVEDIRQYGLREPIWLYEGKIIDGRNRYRACLEAGIEPTCRVWDGQGSLVAFVVSLNQHRRHSSPSQLALSAAKAAEMLEQEAAERQRAGTLASNEAKGRSADKAAELFGVSGATVERARKVLEEGSPELIEAVESGEVSVSAAADIATLPQEEQEELVARGEKEILQAAKKIRQQRKTQNAKKRADILSAATSIPEGKYQCIVIDPPWPTQKIERDERPNQVGFDYPTMTEEELQNFPLARFAADNCHLYLWATHKYLPTAFRLAEHWGFKYQCLLTWVKNVGFTPFSWMYSTEHILFCRRGNLDLLVKGRRLDFQAKVREHSRKPDEFYDLVKTVSPGPYLDIFSREPREGFAQYGKEVEKFA